MTTQNFIDYYETKHVPFICALAAPPPVYKRNYVLRGEPFNQGEEALNFDVVTEMVFPHRKAYDLWQSKIVAPGVAERVTADEEKFLDRSKTRAYLFDEHSTSQ